MSRVKGSLDSLVEATRNRAKFSGHGDSMGTAGLVDTAETSVEGLPLAEPGDMAVVNPQEHGFRPIKIGMAWDNKTKNGKKRNAVEKMAVKAVSLAHSGVDLDLGCMYELQSGERGAIQAFGDRFGNFDEAPFITLSGDERTGDAPGDDEYLVINGQKWPEIKKILLYVYIYGGTPDWSVVQPTVHVRVPGEQPLAIIPAVQDSKMAVCAVATLENVRNGIRLTRRTEYFAGHDEMDRAYGFGIVWTDGTKS